MAYDFMSLLSNASLGSMKRSFEIEMLSVHKLVPASDNKNFYHADEDEVIQIARSIEITGGIKQNLVVKPIPGTDTYEVIAGHKRRLAVLLLLQEGKEEYEYVPCMIEREESDKDAVLNELSLIFTNSTQRDETDAETMHAAIRAKELLEEYDKTYGLSGDKDKIVAELLGTSRSKVGRLKTIYNNLIPEFMKEFEYGSINVSVANEIAGIKDKEEQLSLYKRYMDNGQITIQDVLEAKQRQQIKGQMDINEYPEYLPEHHESEKAVDSDVTKNLPQIGEEKEGLEKEPEEEVSEDSQVDDEKEPEKEEDVTEVPQIGEDEEETEAQEHEDIAPRVPQIGEDSGEGNPDKDVSAVPESQNTQGEYSDISIHEKIECLERLYDDAKRYGDMSLRDGRRKLFVKYTTMMEAYRFYADYLNRKINFPVSPIIDNLAADEVEQEENQ